MLETYVYTLVVPELRFGVLRSAFQNAQMDLRFGPRFEFAFRLHFGCFFNTSRAVLAFRNCVLSHMAREH